MLVYERAHYWPSSAGYTGRMQSDMRHYYQLARERRLRAASSCLVFIVLAAATLGAVMLIFHPAGWGQLVLIGVYLYILQPIVLCVIIANLAVWLVYSLRLLFMR